tara:strand:- start:12042 stop:14051 length:2010 start_codon:yes stop_codon:yes gene_type:complete
MIGMVPGSLAKGLLGGSAKKSSVQGASRAIVGQTKQDGEERAKEKPKAIPVKRSSRSSGGMSLAKFTGTSRPEEKVEKIQVEEEGDEKVASSLTSLDKATKSLKESMVALVAFRRKQDKEIEKEERTATREAKEKGFEIGVPGFVRKAVQPLINRTMDYLKNILIGGIILAIVQNLEKIIDYIKELWNETLKPIFEWMNKWIFQPMWTGLKWIVNEGVPIVKEILAHPITQTVIDGIKAGLDEIGKLFGPLQNAIKRITGMDFGSGQGGGSGTYDTSSGGLLAGGGVDMGSAAKEQISQAGFGESEFTLFRDAVAQIESGGEYDIQGGSGDMYAGRYQMGAAARQDAARFLGEQYQGDDEAARKRFREDPDMQERYFAAYTRANHQTLMRDKTYAAMSNEQKLQVLGYAHNAGAGNALDWMKSNMQGSFEDGFGTKSSKYADSIRRAQERRRQPLPPSMRSRGTTPVAGESIVSSDIKDFRKFRTSMGGSATRQPTANPDYYQIREMGVYGSGNYNISPLADDTNYEIGLHKGAGHHENRAFDIPVPPNSAQGDRVAKFWRDRGYTVIWRSAGHYDHVHVEVPKARAEEFFKVIPELQKPAPPSDRAKKVSTEPSYSKTKKTVVVASNPPATPVVVGGGGSGLPASGGSDKKALNSLTRQRANSQLYSA